MNVSKSRMLSFLMMCVTILTGASHEEKSLIPKEMVYIGHGPSVMGIDREAPSDLDKKPKAYESRM